MPSEMDIIPLVVDLGTAMMKLRGYPGRDRDTIRLAIHETLVNAIQHGGSTKPDSRIRIRFYFKRSSFYTDIEDEGAGFDPDSLADPTCPENLMKPGGRGIFLVRNLTENFKITCLPKRGVRVTFSLGRKSEDEK
ncbi:ATP-binding protein [bacterium]|nr:ATP-binding protein [candidate division CSSED10-310 bacterium]